jgi:hypothetical protein
LDAVVAELVDTSCGSMARYMGRLVGWYTAGGFTDECGQFHESGLHYDWYLLRGLLAQQSVGCREREIGADSIIRELLRREIFPLLEQLMVVGGGAGMAYRS